MPALASGCNPRIHEVGAETQDSNEASTSAAPHGDEPSTSATDTDAESICPNPVDDEAPGESRTFRVSNGRTAPVYIRFAHCTFRVVMVASTELEADSPSCLKPCSDLGYGVSGSCYHCASTVIKLEPGGIYEETWDGTLLERVDVPIECSQAEDRCGRRMIADGTLSATILASTDLYCEGDDCDCSAGMDGWCTISGDVLGDDLVTQRMFAANETEIIDLQID